MTLPLHDIVSSVDLGPETYVSLACLSLFAASRVMGNALSLIGEQHHVCERRKRQTPVGYRRSQSFRDMNRRSVYTTRGPLSPPPLPHGNKQQGPRGGPSREHKSWPAANSLTGSAESGQHDAFQSPERKTAPASSRLDDEKTQRLIFSGRLQTLSISRIPH